MSSLIDKGKVADKISDLFLDNYPNPSKELETFYKEVLKIVVNAETQSNWTSVKDRLPETDVNVLAFSPERDEIIICSYVGFSYKYGKDGAWMYWGENPPDYITHWMSLPQIPESEGIE